MKTIKKPFILDVEPKQLSSVLKPLIKEEYRINQIKEWLYSKKAASFEQFTNIPKDIRGNLESSFILRSFSNIKKAESVLDGTIRYTFKTCDSHYIYAVYLPSNEKKNSLYFHSDRLSGILQILFVRKNKICQKFIQRRNFGTDYAH